jgi:hypothetical protein
MDFDKTAHSGFLNQGTALASGIPVSASTGVTLENI